MPGSAVLVCPVTKQPLRAVPMEEADGDRPLVPRRTTGGGAASQHAGRTPAVMLRADGEVAYPVIDGIPILLAPEMLVRDPEAPPYDVGKPPYAEAYQEMAFYNEFASGGEGGGELERYADMLRPAVGLSPAELAKFPEPKELWIDAVYDAAAQMDCYVHLAPVRDRIILQLGGKGLHAVKFLLAGAKEAWVVTPMLQEARWAVAFAAMLGVSERLRCVVGIAEELPFGDGTIDGIYAGGTVHHVVTPVALPEVRRALRRGGAFAAAEPWRTPWYAIGTRVFGKREPSVYCRPLDKTRVAPLTTTFRSGRRVHHGALSRYLLLVLDKLGLESSLRTAWTLNRIDDALSSLTGLRRLGSSVSLLAIKE
ncbi:MAG TPA: methyltransferase domain-containing protein [Thermoanaerobaculia bacterium]|nr:methyltransferase domain-containing protein [Thermoanaerobaculia bacterium]